MAHEIDQTTGRAAVFVTGEPAWHLLIVGNGRLAALREVYKDSAPTPESTVRAAGGG